jgi:charged multivesicular body protein 2A
MMQSMKGATMLLGSMNRQMNLPALQRIAMEFERENEIMDERQEMMDDAIDEATGMEGEEEEGEDIVKEVLDEIGVDLSSAVRITSISHWGADLLTRPLNSLAKRRQGYRKSRSARHALPKQLELAVLAAPMTISKQGWTASGDNHMLCFPGTR